MPRPKPDQIIRHQIVFGEADRKILSSAVDSYNLNTVLGNMTKVLNDVTGTITILTLLGATGILGLVFAFNVNPLHLATGNVPAIIMSFNEQWNQASDEKKERDGLTREQRFSQTAENLASDPLTMFSNLFPAAKVADIYRDVYL